MMKHERQPEMTVRRIYGQYVLLTESNRLTALKTLTLRLRGSKTELEEMGEDVTDMATTTSQLQAKLLALTGGQVDIMADATTFKNSTQILREMADAWEDMTDIQRASALELMGGKRQANVLSALIQNFDTVEKVIETSANSAGSALKENERYLDSIQGKIDQFNNALQAMWSNFLNADIVKDFVAFGTEIVKIIDEIGLLGSALIALAAYKGFGAVFDVFRSAGISVDFLTKKLGSYVFGINTAAAAETTLTQAQVAQRLAQQGLTAEQAQAIAAQTGLATSTANLSRETLIASLQAKGYSAAEAEAIATKIFGTAVTNASTGALIQETIKLKLANSALVQYAIQMGYATAAEVTNMGVTQLLGLSFSTLAKTIGAATVALAKFLFINPVGWAILAVGAIAGGIAIFNHFHKTTEELTEELEDLKAELQDIQSEIETVNSELETMEDRMAELLAKDSLSFVEQEELDRLQKENNELQRRLDLLEEEEKIKQNKAAETFVQTMESYGDKTYKRGGEMNWWQRLWSGDSAYAESQDEYINKLMSEYDRVLKVDSGELDRSVLVDEMDADWYSEKIGTEVQALVDAANGLDYFEGDNLTDKQKEVNEWLDYVYNTQDKLAIMRGGENAKTNAINRIFDKDENAAISDSIDEYVEALRKGDTSAKTSIENIIKNNKTLVEDLEASGLSVGEAVDYFTSFASELEFATLEGKIKEVSSAAKSFESLLKGGLFKVDGVDTGLAGLFDEEGKIIQTKLSQVFQGTSEQTREDITRLLEGSYDQIKNGTVDVKRLLSGFALKTTQQVLEIQNKVLGEQNLELFPNLKDEIDGIIDKFSEFSTAVGSVVDALDTLEQARAEEAYSGSISIETLENLMKYTDDYTQLVEIDETGAIKLAADAEQILIEQRLQKIKTDAAAAVQTAQANLEQAKYNAKAVNETGPVQAALTSATDALAGSWAYLGSIIGDITAGNFSGIFERASAAYSNVTAGREEKRAQVNVSVEDAEEALAKALDQQKIANALTSENVKSKYSSDDASGGNGTEDEVKDERFQKEMDYWENRIGANQAKYEQIQHEIDMLESQGRKAGAKYYQEQINLENQRLDLLTQQKTAAQTYLDQLTAAGKEGSEEWWEVANTLNDIEAEFDDVTASIVDLQDAIGEIDSYKFEEFNTRLDDIISKLGTIRDLIAPDGEEDWFDEQGDWTEEGVAVLGTYIQELETYKQGLAEAEDAYADYVKEYAGNEKYYAALGIHSEQELYDKRQELIEQQYDYAQSISDTEQSVVDMYESNIDAIEEYTDTLIDSYNDYIDSVKEALDAERDYTLWKQSYSPLYMETYIMYSFELLENP
jgi:prefoldin subunit 5